ncbi:BIRC3-like protein [Mya arenaria]|uniref:BIRC3-like protein n=2 Tax=Mya arenaria TaxID=6604 RepID=A0ABY7G017_MYAAR|nr:BIRC3-like protein [Mya arenaria]
MIPEDDPLIEHKKHGPPTCPFLTKMSGDNQKEDIEDNGASVLTNDKAGKMDELSDLEEENVRLKERTTCKVCRESPAIVLLLPCSHLAACVQCGPSLTVCPVCERKVVESVKTFLG